jgi:hypothetical protein
VIAHAPFTVRPLNKTDVLHDQRPEGAQTHAPLSSVHRSPFPPLSPTHGRLPPADLDDGGAIADKFNQP